MCEEEREMDLIQPKKMFLFSSGQWVEKQRKSNGKRTEPRQDNEPPAEAEKNTKQKENCLSRSSHNMRGNIQEHQCKSQTQLLPS